MGNYSNDTINVLNVLLSNTSHHTLQMCPCCKKIVTYTHYNIYTMSEHAGNSKCKFLVGNVMYYEIFTSLHNNSVSESQIQPQPTTTLFVRYFTGLLPPPTPQMLSRWAMPWFIDSSTSAFSKAVLINKYSYVNQRETTSSLVTLMLMAE